MVLYSSAEGNQGKTKYARVVELVDSLDSGSSVHCGRAGSSPASRTINADTQSGIRIFIAPRDLESVAKQTSVAADSWTEANLYLRIAKKQ